MCICVPWTTIQIWRNQGNLFYGKYKRKPAIHEIKKTRSHHSVLNRIPAQKVHAFEPHKGNTTPVKY